MKNSTNKRAGARTSRKTPVAAIQPNKGQADTPASKASRNKANTIRNSAKVEHFLMEVEKARGFAASWAIRERLEQGHVSFDEVVRR